MHRYRFILADYCSKATGTGSIVSRLVPIFPDRQKSLLSALSYIVMVGLVLVLTAGSTPARGQPTVEQDRSGLTALALNMLVPGLGHRYLNGGRWSGWAPVFTGADVTLALGLAGTIWHRDQQLEVYRTLAAGEAGARVDGKDRAFFVQMAAYRSQEQYVEYLLRSRQWTSLQQAEDPSRFWKWESDDAWKQYKSTRSRVDALARRRTILITAMVANRVVSGITALLRARSNDAVPRAAVDVGSNPAGAVQPRVRLQWQW